MTDDPFLWLEEVEGEQALEWVKAQNETALEELEAHPDFEELTARLQAVLDSPEKIPSPSIVGSHIYNFWRDEDHVKGLWRRTTLDSYCTEEPDWEEVLNVDRLAEDEDENWVFKGATFLRPNFDRCLVHLSRGGADATVVREFDAKTLSFVSGGFEVPEAKTSVCWRDRDHLYLGTDFGPGSLTDSGYSRVRKLWRRGTAIEEAELVFEAEKKDVGLWTMVLHRPEGRYDLMQRSMTFYTRRVFWLHQNEWHDLPLPDDAEVHEIFAGQMVFELKSEWEGHPQGSLLAIDLEAFLNGNREFETLVEPGPRRSIAYVGCTRDSLLINLLENVSNRLFVWKFENGRWNSERVDIGEEQATVAVTGSSSLHDHYFVTTTGFLSPSALHLVQPGRPHRLVKTLPSFFDESAFRVDQNWATSKDGTEVPYFLIRHHAREGPTPTVLYGYGGFEVSLTANYLSLVGRAWLEKGGTYAIANIRGGGEFGPKWHRAALKEHRHLCFEDFEAVAEDLVSRGLTTPKQLGIKGGSNGGLLVGAAFTRRPELYGAVVCQVPLLDMRRYHTLLAGASWMGEYGDPDDPEQWKFISTYSPYHHVSPEGRYPRVFFTTSTRDDRVHPGHARKMVARMKEQGHPVLYYENMEGGHAGASDNRQVAYVGALTYMYLYRQLGVEAQVAATNSGTGPTSSAI